MWCRTVCRLGNDGLFGRCHEWGHDCQEGVVSNGLKENIYSAAHSCSIFDFYSAR